MTGETHMCSTWEYLELMRIKHFYCSFQLKAHFRGIPDTVPFEDNLIYSEGMYAGKCVIVH